MTEPTMRKSIILLAFCVMVLQGCDFVRMVAGRPTSAQLEQIRQDRIAAQEAARQARLDSIERAEKAAAELAAAREAHLLDSLSQSKGTVVWTPSKQAGSSSAKPEGKYCIVLGVFSNPDNAERKRNQSIQAGYPASFITYRNGKKAVVILPSNSLEETMNKLKEVRGTFPDAWLQINK